MIELDAAWRAANPLPVLGGRTNKNSRGRVLAIGGSRTVPGAIRLTGEAALRAGAGKVRIATFADAVVALAAAFPEAGYVALAEEAGEIRVADEAVLRENADRTDAIVLGPGISDRDAARRMVRFLAEEPAEAALVLDAAAVACAAPLQRALAGYAGRLVLTPHEEEMAALCGRDAEEVRAAGEAVALEMAARFGAVIALKGTETLVTAPDGTVLHFAGGGAGLATGGSGDVLAGIIAGLLARGAEPLVATGWGVWLHGEAGRALAARQAPLGFLARELLPEIPHLLPR